MITFHYVNILIFHFFHHQNIQISLSFFSILFSSSSADELDALELVTNLTTYSSHLLCTIFSQIFLYKSVMIYNDISITMYSDLKQSIIRNWSELICSLNTEGLDNYTGGLYINNYKQPSICSHVYRKKIENQPHRNIFLKLSTSKEWYFIGILWTAL